MKTIILTLIFSFVNFIGGSEIEIISRNKWNARDPTDNITKLNLPISKVIIAHTATDECHDRTSCIRIVQSIQNYHINTRNFYDIAYNFLISDGMIFEGRGWLEEGAHTKGYNNNTIGIAFIGNFNKKEPTTGLNTARFLLDNGVVFKVLSKDYKVYGHRQLSSTESPGDALYKEIKTWPEWSSDIS